MEMKSFQGKINFSASSLVLLVTIVAVPSSLLIPPQHQQRPSMPAAPSDTVLDVVVAVGGGEGQEAAFGGRAPRP